MKKLCSGLILALLQVAALRGYVSNGHAWATAVIPYYTNLSANATPLSNADILAALQAASGAWHAQAGASVPTFQRMGDTAISTMTFDLTATVILRNSAPPSTCAYCMAETYWWYDGTGHLVDFDQTWYEPNYVYYRGTAPSDSSGCAGNGEYMADVATHEFGHALGLAHSSVTSATMYATNNYCDTSWYSLDADDIAGVLSLYPVGSAVPPPTTTTIPPPPPVTGPTLPTNPVPSNGQKNRGINQDLAWTGCAGCSYDVWAGTTAAGQTVRAQGVTAAAYALDQLSHRETYYWHVVASLNGQSVTGPTWSFSTR